MNIRCHVFKRIRCVILLGSMLAAATAAEAQSTDIIVKGTVRSDSAALEGVTIFLKTDPNRAVRSNEKGYYQIKAPSNGTLVFSFVGYKPTESAIKGEPVKNILLQASESAMEEVAVVAYGTQKKSSMVSAVTTINPKELKGPTGNLTTMLAGRISGVIAYQRSGEPGADNAQFFIRGITTFGSGKQNPLILIDGMESSPTDLARFQPDDIAGFSVLKDATASSLYGARGANGVILVTTKLGVQGKAKFNVRFENSLSSNTRNLQNADNITYMKLANEAEVARVDNPIQPYSMDKIENTAAGKDPYLYPSNNWLKSMIKDYTNNQRLNINLNGGGEVAQYYIAGTYNIDNGVLKVENLNNFNNNIKLKNYSIRSNININVTPTTQIVVRTYGQFDDYNGPLGTDFVGGGEAIFIQARAANPVEFPLMYPQLYAPTLKHPLFGNAKDGAGEGYSYNNPYANAVSGYQQYNTSSLIAQLELKQNLNFLLPGLSGRVMTYTERNSYFDIKRRYLPFYYKLEYAAGTKDPRLVSLNSDGQEYLSYEPGSKRINTVSYIEAAVNYTTTFNRVNTVSGMLISTMQNVLDANAGDLQTSLPRRNQGLSGRFTYGYDNRYLTELNFGYNGSERFAANNRFGFFPSVGVAWNLSNEKFFKPYTRTVNKLKLRATHGVVGNDQIGDDKDRFFYLSNVHMNDVNKGATFGENYDYDLPGVSVSRYENPTITWERSSKTNLGLELGLWTSLNIQVDVYKEKRSNILMDRPTIPGTMGLNAGVKANVGKAEGKGIDVQMDYNKTLNKNVWIQARGNFTYAASKLTEKEEPNYPESYRSKVGWSLSQNWGLLAERLFIDEAEVANSPVQQWGRVRAGDIKYRDVNGDGQIEGDGDQVPIGHPTTPEITFGYGLSVGYKSFDISAFFQGSARSSIFINSNDIQPYQVYSRDDMPGIALQNGLLTEIANDHWSEENRNIYAFWPRLSRNSVENNQWTSTWWLRTGTFLRLKNVELGYNLPQRIQKKARLTNTRVYLNASNLMVISKFKMWDPEMGGNGLGYPVQRVINVGINVGF